MCMYDARCGHYVVPTSYQPIALLLVVTRLPCLYICRTLTIVSTHTDTRVWRRVGTEMLHLSVDACGGMATDAVRLVRAIGEEGEVCSAGVYGAVSLLSACC